MTHYLLSVYQPEGDAPPPEVLEEIARDLDAFHQELVAAGAWGLRRGVALPEHGDGRAGSG